MPRKSRKNVGLIGLGIIGSRVAQALRSANYSVYVWSRTPRAQPNFLGSPAEVAEVCDIVQLFVSDAEALFAVIDGFEDRLTARNVIVCNATVGPDATIEAARRVAEKGGKFVDAPFTGSKAAAERREMVYYLGGDDDLLDRVDPILRASSKATVRIGHVGQAAAVKIATNMLVATTAQTLAETVAVVQRAGVNPVVLEEALEHHAVHSKLIDMKLPMMLQGDYEPHFSVRNLYKDVQLAIALANAREIEIPATTAAAGVLYSGVNRGWGDLDFAAVMKMYGEQDVPPPQLTDAALIAEPELEPGAEEAPEGGGASAEEVIVPEATSFVGEDVPPEETPVSEPEPVSESVSESEGEPLPEPEPEPEPLPEFQSQPEQPARTDQSAGHDGSPVEGTSEVVEGSVPEDPVEGDLSEPDEKSADPQDDAPSSTDPEPTVPARGLLRRFFG